MKEFTRLSSPGWCCQMIKGGVPTPGVPGGAAPLGWTRAARVGCRISGKAAAYSAVVGSMSRRTAETRFAGKLPLFACSLMVASSGARYTQ